MFYVAKAKRQVQVFFVAKAKRQVQVFFCSESEAAGTEVSHSYKR
ncbi:hypothetical protein [Lysinibacillus xylanilyticus]